jgi:hypothetical protein
MTADHPLQHSFERQVIHAARSTVTLPGGVDQGQIAGLSFLCEALFQG